MKQLLLILVSIAMLACSNVTSSNDDNKEVNNLKKTPISSTKISKPTEVMTLGTFHFTFPNFDVEKTEEEDQIDVLEPKYQKEIELIVNKLTKFKPTKIVVEMPAGYQNELDSLYTLYLNGKYTLERNEKYQIGFRLAKKLRLKKLYACDSWGVHYEEVTKLLKGKDSVAKQKFMDFFYNDPDSLLSATRNEIEIFKTQGITAELKRINTDEDIKNNLGDYLIGIFKYETPENKNFGADFTTGWWFNRNLRIFRNIQRINATSEDRVLVIYGAGHMNLLNIFFEASPEYKLLKVNDYL